MGNKAFPHPSRSDESGGRTGDGRAVVCEVPSTLASLVTLCAVGLLARLSYALARTPVLALFAVHLGAPPETIGLVVGISTVTGILFKLPSGILSDIFGRRVMLIAGLVFFAFVPFAYGLVEDYRGLVAIRFLHGFATAVYSPVAMAAVADIAGRRKAEMMSVFGAVSVVGGLAGAPLGGFLLWWLAGDAAPGLADFHLIYGVAGGFGLLALATAVAQIGALSLGQLSARERRSPAAVARRFAEGVRQMASDYAVIVTSSMQGLQHMALGALEAFLPVYAVTVAGLNAFESGLLWGVQVLSALVAKPVMGRVADRHGRKPLIVAGMLLCAGALAGIPAATAFAPLMALAVLFGLGEALVVSSAAAMVADLCEARHTGAAMGAFGTYFDVGHAAGPIAAGLLLAAFPGDYFVAFLPLAAVLVLGALAFALSVEERRRRGDVGNNEPEMPIGA